MTISSEHQVGEDLARADDDWVVVSNHAPKEYLPSHPNSGSSNKRTEKMQKAFKAALVVGAFICLLVFLVLICAYWSVKRQDPYDPYAILEIPDHVDRNAHDISTIIRKAFRRVSMKLHPERYMNGLEEEEASRKFALATQAYCVLSDHSTNQQDPDSYEALAARNFQQFGHPDGNTVQRVIRWTATISWFSWTMMVLFELLVIIILSRGRAVTLLGV